MQAGATYTALVGAVITDLRNQKVISQGDLAKGVGMSQSAWSRIEKGGAVMSVDQLARAAKKLGVLPGEILARADNTARQMQAQGFEVSYEKPQRSPESGDNSGLLFLGGAALAALIYAANKK